MAKGKRSSRQISSAVARSGLMALIDGQLSFCSSRQALGVFRVADAGDGSTVAPSRLASQAAEPCSVSSLPVAATITSAVSTPASMSVRSVRAVAADAQHVQRIARALQHVLVLIDNHDVVSLAGQLLCHGMADFAVADSSLRIIRKSSHCAVHQIFRPASPYLSQFAQKEIPSCSRESAHAACVLTAGDG